MNPQIRRAIDVTSAHAAPAGGISPGTRITLAVGSSWAAALVTVLVGWAIVYRDPQQAAHLSSAVARLPLLAAGLIAGVVAALLGVRRVPALVTAAAPVPALLLAGGLALRSARGLGVDLGGLGLGGLTLAVAAGCGLVAGLLTGRVRDREVEG